MQVMVNDHRNRNATYDDLRNINTTDGHYRNRNTTYGQRPYKYKYTTMH